MYCHLQNGCPLILFSSPKHVGLCYFRSGVKIKCVFILFFARLFVTLPLSHVDCTLMGVDGQGDKTYIKAFTTLWF